MAAVSEVLQVVTDRLKCPLIEKLSSMWDLKDKLERLLSTLPNLQTVLEDQRALEVGILLQLQDSASYVEDLLEDLITVNNEDDHHIRDQQYADVVKVAFADLQSTADQFLTNWLRHFYESLTTDGIVQTTWKKLKRSLQYVHAILEDAEEKQVVDRDVRTWLSELKRVVYDAEDLLDQIDAYGSVLEEHGPVDGSRLNPIQWCEELSYFPSGLQNLNALGSLEIGDCHRLMFLPEIGTNSFCSLQTLSIENCSNLTSLSIGLKNLTSLENLIVMYCPSLVALPQGVQNLTALQSLTILGFSPEFMPLPKELQNLTRLHNLEIRSCPGLEILSGWTENLVSLRSLSISDCHNIGFVPQGIKHLTVLQHLSIQGCPQLLKSCRQKSGEDRPKIAHIPYKHLGLPQLRHPSAASSSSN